jgi:uncharacterized protein
MLQAELIAKRLIQSIELPGYAFIPGMGLPHPMRDPRGHSHGRKRVSPPALHMENWSTHRNYLLGLDLFNFGYYWEAHEEWDRLLKSSGPDTLTGKFLKGLVKLSAAGVKVREGSIHGVRRHAASAGEVFADVAAESDTDTYCGLEFTILQFAADRAAQLNYKQKFETGKPVRVFPFLLHPESEAIS